MTHFHQLSPVLGLLWLGNCQPGKYHGLSRLVPAFKPDPFWLPSLAYETEPQDPAPNARAQLPIHQQDLSAQSASRDAQVQTKVTHCLYKHLLGACPVCVRQSSPGWEFKKMQALPLGRSQLGGELVMKTNPEINSRTSQVFSELIGKNNYFCWEDQEVFRSLWS